MLGGLAAWFAIEAQSLTGSAAAQNTAITDHAATSQLIHQVSSAIDTAYSYSYSDLAATRQKARHLLTGNAVKQYGTVLTQQQQQIQQQKLILTTTVIQSGVEMLQGNRARLLVFANQHYTSTKGNGDSATMIAVNAVRQNGVWKIGKLDYLTGS